MARGIDEPWITARTVPADLARVWAREWPGWFGPARVALARAAGKPWLARVETPLGPVVAKRARERGWKRSLLALGARRPRCERVFHLAETLRARGLATPEPLAVLGQPGETVLVTRLVDGVGLWELVPDLAPHERRLACLAAGIARLHGAGFRHRDLKASNLLFLCAEVEPELVWIDLDGVSFRGTVEPHLRVRDLARLCTSFASAEARTAGIRADAWPTLVRLYLERALGRAPLAAEVDRFLARTRAWSDRNIRRHLAADRPVL
jgi:tRNA A-37 threonylcarbamoyl transferase component Bud32